MPYFVYGSKFSKYKTHSLAKFLPTPPKMPARLTAFTKTAKSKFKSATSSDKASSNFRKTPSPSAFRAVRC